MNNILQKLLVLTFFATSFLAAYSNVKKLEESTFKSSQIEFYSSTNNKLLKAQKIFSHDLGQGNFSWNGKLTNGEEGLLTFTKIKGTTQGTVRFKGGQTYSLGTTNAGAVFFLLKNRPVKGVPVVSIPTNLPPSIREHSGGPKIGETETVTLLIYSLHTPLMQESH